MRTFLVRPGATSSRRAGPAWWRTGGRSIMTAGALVAFFAVAPHTGGTSRTRAKRARGIIDPKDLYAVEAVRGAGDGLLDLGRECVVGGVPGDPQGSCYPADRHALQGKGPQPPHDCRAGQPRPGPAKVEASCLHTRRQRVQAKRRRRTTSCVGLHPTGTWARRRATVPRACPRAPQTLQNGSSNPIGMRQSISARLAVTQLAHRRQSQNLQAQQGRQIRTGESSLRHVETSQLSCVAAPIIGRPRPLPTTTTHPPPPTHLNRPHLPHPQTRKAGKGHH